MNTEERLAQINEVSQRILNMPEAERQAYQQQYGQAINDMLAEYNQIKASQKQQQMEARNRGDSLADMYRDANGNVIGVHNDGSQVILEAAPRKETPKRRQTPPKDREVKETIIEETTPIEVNVDEPELTGYKTEDPRYAKGNNNGGNNGSYGAWPWVIMGGLGTLGAGTHYLLNHADNNKPKILPPGTTIPGKTPALGEVREGKVIQQGPRGHLPGYSTPALGEVRDGKIVSEGLLSDGKVIVQGPKGNLPDKRNTSISQIMSRPGVYEPVEGYHTPSDIASKSKNRISQIMSRPGNFEPVEGYHTPVNSTVETAAEKGAKNAVKKGAKNVAEKGVWSAAKKGAKKVLPKFIQKAIF